MININTIDIKIPIEAPKEKPSTLSFEQLQQRIDKAIEYINKTNFWGIYDDTPMIDVKYGEDLLKILKGEKND